MTRCPRCNGTVALDRQAYGADERVCVRCGWSPATGRAPTEAERREVEPQLGGTKRRAPSKYGMAL